jgi:dTDP-4-amino-4,6-dideoxygalactose transaminase
MAELAVRGGPPVRPQGYPEWPVRDERDVEAVAMVVRSGRWGGFPEPGPLAAEFSARFAAYQGARHGVVMSNGTVTMEVALKALGIGWGDEVIVPALTFAATPCAAMAAGALPVFCDVVPDTLTIDPDQVEAAVTPRTRAIMPVHLGHQMADMDWVMKIARRHSLAVVEDCAHAPGQRWHDQGAGSIGDFGSFSHQSYKILTAGEGGSLLTGDEQLARRAHSLIDCGRPKDAGEKDYTFGANYRLGELHAALLLAALERFPAQQAERAENARRFQELAAGVPGVRLLPPDERITRWSFYCYVLLIEPEAFAGAPNRLVCEALEAEGVGCWTGYPPMSRYDLFQPSLSRLPVAVAHAARLDPARMSFPIAERLALRHTVYLDENVFRAGPGGVEDAVEAIAKVQRHAAELDGHSATR